MKTTMEINKEKKDEMKERIIEYFFKERDEDLGDLATQLLLSFFIDQLGPYIYNQGVEDAHLYMKDKLDDLFALQIVKR